CSSDLPSRQLIAANARHQPSSNGRTPLRLGVMEASAPIGAGRRGRVHALNEPAPSGWRRPSAVKFPSALMVLPLGVSTLFPYANFARTSFISCLEKARKVWVRTLPPAARA